MSNIVSLEALASAAAANNNTATSVSMRTMSVEDARKVVVVKDGFKKPKEDGSQALTLVCGKIKLNLNFIAPNATLINVTAEQVEPYTEALLALVAEGKADEAIAEAQAKAQASFEKARAPKVAAAPELEEEVTAEEVEEAGVDLEGL